MLEKNTTGQLARWIGILKTMVTVSIYPGTTGFQDGKQKTYVESVTEQTSHSNKFIVINVTLVC